MKTFKIGFRFHETVCVPVKRTCSLLSKTPKIFDIRQLFVKIRWFEDEGPWFFHVRLIFQHRTLRCWNISLHGKISAWHGKIMDPHLQINLSSRIIVGWQKFWVFWKVESPCVALAHKPFSKNEILFKKFSNQNKNVHYFHEIASLTRPNPSEYPLRKSRNRRCMTTRFGSWL